MGDAKDSGSGSGGGGAPKRLPRLENKDLTLQEVTIENASLLCLTYPVRYGGILIARRFIDQSTLRALNLEPCTVCMRVLCFHVYG
jgi:hypothetical protein